MTDIKTISRRTLVKTGIGALAAPAVLRVLPAQAQSQVIKIGHVSPKTGPLAGFGEADSFILEQVRGILSKGLSNGGKTYKVEIISKDSQSNASRASEVASELILGDKVNLIVASATPDTTNPVSDQAEVNEVPCITTNCPWQPYFFGRKGDPKKGFTWTYHFFWGLEDVIGVVPGAVGRIADQQGGRRAVPQRRRRQCLGRSQARPAAGAGEGRLQAGRSRPLSADEQRLHLADFRVQGGGRRDRHRQHDPARLRDLLVAGGAAGLQAEDRHHRQGAAVPLGDRLAGRARQRAHQRNLVDAASSVQVRPHRPERQQLTDAYTKATNRPWTQPIGFQHALFEVAIDVLKRAKNLNDPKSILESIVATNYQSMVGPIQWTGAPVKNVTKTPLVAGQWQRKNGKFDLVITENKTAPNIPVGGKLQPIS